MAKTLIDLDPELLAQARHALGTDAKKATVHEALRDVVRRWAAMEFSHLARNGIFNGLLKPDPQEQPCQ
jgi:Arc/MetJ family transcription regulator